MLAYTNRFLGLASLLRKLLDKYKETKESVILEQIKSLRYRIDLIQHTQSLGILSLIFCITSLGSIMFHTILAYYFFGIALVLMIGSLFLSFWEILLSIKALDLEIEGVLVDIHI